MFGFNSTPETEFVVRRVQKNFPESQAELSSVPPMMFQSGSDLISKPQSPSLQRNKNFLKPISDSPRLIHIEFKDIFENKHLSHAFKEYLKLAHTEEQFIFCCECRDKLKPIDSSETSKEMAKLAIELYEKYIFEDSETVLNFSSEEREQFGIEAKIEKLKKNNPPIWNLDVSPIQMFTPIVNCLKVSIQQAHFVDFKKTKLCREAVKIMDREFVEIYEIKDLDVPIVNEEKRFSL